MPTIEYLRVAGEVCVKELRILLRDRHTLIYTVALPAFLYPAIFLGVTQVILYTEAVKERRPVTVLLAGEAAAELRERLAGVLGVDSGEGEAAELVEIVLGSKEETGEASARARLDPSQPDGSGGSRSADVVCAVGRGDPRRTGGLSPLAVKLYYSAASDASIEAKKRIDDALERVRDDMVGEAAAAVGAGAAFLEPLAVKSESLSTPGELANRVLGLLLPLLLTLMTAVGAFYPALETTVGEKERGTIETTLACGADRSAIAWGKYLAVTSTALLSCVLNAASMTFTLAQLRTHIPFDAFRLSLAGALVVAGAGFSLAAFISALMMLAAALARSLKEGQTYVMPIYLLSLSPILVSVDAEVELTPGLALVPVAGTALCLRKALEGQIEPLSTVLAVASPVLLTALALAAAGRLLGCEELLAGGGVGLRRAWRLLFAGRASGEDGR